MRNTGQSEQANRDFIRQAMRAPLLDRDVERDLARRWRDDGDEPALHELTSAYMRLVVSIATRFRHYGLPTSDLIQEGCVGLLQAAARFEPEREVRFSTYASWWVRAAMQDYILRNWSIVRTGTTAAQKALFFNLRRLRARLDQADGPMTMESRDKVAKALKVSVTDVEAMEQRLAANDRSLNAAVTEDSDGEWQNFLPDERPGPEEVVTTRHDGEVRSRWLSDAMVELSAREREIIKARRLQEESVTLEHLGGRLGISKERVRQIEHQALRKLRSALTAQAGEEAVFELIC
ncbi:MAG: RNA polymerase factor sigma-32 [Alphaproteobacteria bacterium]